MNAKSSPEGCVYRLLPVAVEYENFEFDHSKGSQFVLDYYVAGQFESIYYTNPAIKVLTSVSNELIGLENVQVTYESNNTNVLKFETVEDNLVMNFVAEGKATITASVTHAGVTKTFEKEIEYTDISNYPADPISSIVTAEEGEELVFKGVVIASVAVKPAFYLADETGVISVVMSSDEMSKIELGQKIIVKGTKEHYKKETSTSINGQLVLNNATLVANLYGEYESPYAFDTTKSISDLVTIAAAEEATHVVYKLSGTIGLSSGMYPVYIITDPEDSSKSIALYHSSTANYKFLEPYMNQTVEMEIALCNWNDKKEYKGCVLAIYVNGERIPNTFNFPN
jgi:hypothetical protein